MQAPSILSDACIGGSRLVMPQGALALVLFTINFVLMYPVFFPPEHSPLVTPAASPHPTAMAHMSPSMRMPPPKPPHAAEMECKGRPYAAYKACICETVSYMKRRAVCQPSLPPSVVSIQPPRPLLLPPPRPAPVQNPSPSPPPVLRPLWQPAQAPQQQHEFPPTVASRDHLHCRGLPTYSAYQACISLHNPSPPHPPVLRPLWQPAQAPQQQHDFPPRPASRDHLLCRGLPTYSAYKACICSTVGVSVGCAGQSR